MWSHFLIYEHWLWTLGGQLSITILMLITYPAWSNLFILRKPPKPPSQHEIDALFKEVEKILKTRYR